MRYFFGFMIAIGLVILVIFLIFRGGNTTSTRVNTISLPSYASTDAEAIMTIDGPINAEQLHQQIKITVNNGQVTYQQIQGYYGNIVSQQVFSSSQNAYSQFLYALSHAGFTLGLKSKALSNESGYCSTGDRYVFELSQNGSDIQRYWATNCGGVKTYRGNLSLTMSLFEAQVPGYDQLSQNVKL